jgi:hypothetical protein
MSKYNKARKPTGYAPISPKKPPEKKRKLIYSS